jgi:hypothetical protein
MALGCAGARRHRARRRDDHSDENTLADVRRTVFEAEAAHLAGGEFGGDAVAALDRAAEDRVGGGPVR